MAPSGFNNCGREMMAALAKWYKDGNGSITSGGSSNAYTLSPNRTISAYAAGISFVWIANHTNSGAATLNVSSLGAKDIRDRDGTALQSSDILSGSILHTVYDATNGYFRALNIAATASTALRMSDLTDAAISTLYANDMLMWDGVAWINIDPRTAIPEGTTGDSGIVRLTTTAEAAALSSTALAVTPGGLGAAVPATAASAGYQKLLGTNGIKIVWGTHTADVGDTTLTFSSAFSSACYGVFLQINESTVPDRYALKVSGASTTGCTVKNTNGSSASAYYVAIGK